jgi:hypothetical protein
LAIITQDGMKVTEIEEIMKKYNINGFPIVTNKESPYLIGYIFKSDLQMAFGSFRFFKKAAWFKISHHLENI